ncbi:MAG: hypothetical protein PWQ55_2829 [Chloroflexota bacterium]|nr:hypothetical protein [Chloroflexota bacterium]
MKNSNHSSAAMKFRYTFQAFQKDHFWLPGALMALFMIVAVFIGPNQRFNTCRAFLGFTLPLIAGGLSSYAFLEDSALELQFTTARSAWKLIFERLSIIALVITLTALVFQAYAPLIGVDLSPLGGLLARQLIWAAPCLAMLALGSLAALLTRSSPGGFAFVGGLWMFQLFLRGAFADSPILRNVLLFYSAMDPGTQAAAVNQLSLAWIAALLLLATHQLLKKSERYI